MQRLQSWPRWLRFGILSTIPSSLLAILGLPALSLGASEKGLIITYGSIAPALLLPERIQAMSWELGFIAAITINLIWISIFWFAVGAYLGERIKRPPIAVFLWLLIQFVGGLILWFLKDIYVT